MLAKTASASVFKKPTFLLQSKKIPSNSRLQERKSLLKPMKLRSVGQSSLKKECIDYSYSQLSNITSHMSKEEVEIVKFLEEENLRRVDLSEYLKV